MTSLGVALIVNCHCFLVRYLSPESRGAHVGSVCPSGSSLYFLARPSERTLEYLRPYDPRGRGELTFDPSKENFGDLLDDYINILALFRLTEKEHKARNLREIDSNARLEFARVSRLDFYTASGAYLDWVIAKVTIDSDGKTVTIRDRKSGGELRVSTIRPTIDSDGKIESITDVDGKAVPVTDSTNPIVMDAMDTIWIVPPMPIDAKIESKIEVIPIGTEVKVDTGFASYIGHLKSVDRKARSLVVEYPSSGGESGAIESDSITGVLTASNELRLRRIGDDWFNGGGGRSKKGRTKTDVA